MRVGGISYEYQYNKLEGRSNMKIQLLEEIKADIHRFCYDESNGRVVKVLEVLEAKTKQNRLRIVYGVMAIIAIYLVLGHGAELVCNLLGFAYPSYMSVKAIRSDTKEEDTQWLIYWSIFALFSLLDFASEKICGWFPLYWLVKALFLIWLWLPLTRGAEFLYLRHISPFVDRHASAMDAAEQQAAASAFAAAHSATPPGVHALGGEKED